ncbi:MAG: hypothetical protein V3T31_03180 [candidate division Zixibacteria bacterium]
MHRFSKVTLTAVLAVVSLGSMVLAQTDRGTSTVSEYFDLLVSGNIESAGYLFTEAVQERAARFGIEYEHIPVKADCNSPVVRDIERMRDYLRPPVKQVIDLADSGYSRLEYSAVIGRKLVTHYYYAQQMGEYWWLTTSQDIVSRDWDIVESDYLRIHYPPKQKPYLNAATISEADRYLLQAAQDLGLDQAFVDEMKEKKIEYYFCDSDSTVELIGGHRVHGFLDLPTNDIISASFPHYHELVHLLINAKLKRLPIYTLPLLREGAAVCYGGRWGKSPEVLFDLGVFLYQQDIVQLDSILTDYDFRNSSSADIAYPLAGLLVDYLDSKLDQDALFGLYRRFSNSPDSIAAVTANQVKGALSFATESEDWETFIAGFESYIEERVTNGLTATPGLAPNGKDIFSEKNCSVSLSDEYISFSCRLGDKGDKTGSFLWSKNEELASGSSPLFEEQTTGSEFEGFRYAVRFDRNEAGLYDYSSNRLLAKYIWGLSPSDDYFDESTSTVRFSIRKDILKGSLPEKNEIKFQLY